MDQKFLLQKSDGVHAFLKNVENLLEYDEKDSPKHNGEKRYTAVFKELFFGDYVDFLLLIKIYDHHMFMTIKMEKKCIKIEMNYEELHQQFDYLALAIQEYFKEIIWLYKI